MTTVLIDDGIEDDWWNTISTAERQAIEEGLADVEAGRTIPHEEVMKRYEQWL